MSFFIRETPIDDGLCAVALLLPHLHSGLNLFKRLHQLCKDSPTQRGQFDFGHIKPTAMQRRV